MKKKRTKKRIIIISLVVVIFVCLFYSCSYTGSRSGRVIDAVTGKPIESALVNYKWRFSGFMAVVGESFAARYEAATDKDGYYYIPNQRVKRKTIVDGGLLPERVFIYKDKYATYELYREYKKPTVGRSFGYTDNENQIYKKRSNLVKLYPFKEGQSHYEHMKWIKPAIGYYISESLDKELEEERRRSWEERKRAREEKKRARENSKTR